MGTYRFDITVPLPPERAFDLWTDLDRMAEWVVGVTKVTDRTGPVDVAGTSYVTWFGSTKSASTVLDVERPRRIRTRFGSWLLAGETEARFDAAGTGTTITQTFWTRGIIPAIAGWIFSRGSFKGSFRGELESFRKLAAREASTSPSEAPPRG